IAQTDNDAAAIEVDPQAEESNQTPEPTEPPRRRRDDLEAIAEKAAAARDAFLTEKGQAIVDTSDDADDDETPAATPAATPPPASNQAPDPLADDLTPAELAALMKRKVKVNIDGQEDTRTLEQILRDAQKA